MPVETDSRDRNYTCMRIVCVRPAHEQGNDRIRCQFMHQNTPQQINGYLYGRFSGFMPCNYKFTYRVFYFIRWVLYAPQNVNKKIPHHAYMMRYPLQGITSTIATCVVHPLQGLRLRFHYITLSPFYVGSNNYEMFY